MEKVIDNSELRIDGEWLRIWKLQVPHKIKLLLWRIARGCLPTRERIVSKGVECSNRCPFCSLAVEDDWNCFVGCPHVIKVWEAAGLWMTVRPIADAEYTMSGFIFHCLSTPSQQQSKLFAVVLSHAWRRRNDKVWNDDEKPLQLSVQLSMDYLREWESIKHKLSEISNLQQTNRVTRWLKLNQGEYKCNVDAAIFEDQECYGVGMCLRGDNGEFVKATTRWNSGIPSPTEAEARGLLEAISWLRTLGDLKGTIEMDCLPVVDGLVEDRQCDTELGAMLALCKANLNSCNNLKVSFVRRQANL